MRTLLITMLWFIIVCRAWEVIIIFELAFFLSVHKILWSFTENTTNLQNLVHEVILSLLVISNFLVDLCRVALQRPLRLLLDRSRQRCCSYCRLLWWYCLNLSLLSSGGRFFMLNQRRTSWLLLLFFLVGLSLGWLPLWLRWIGLFFHLFLDSFLLGWSTLSLRLSLISFYFFSELSHILGGCVGLLLNTLQLPSDMGDLFTKLVCLHGQSFGLSDHGSLSIDGLFGFSNLWLGIRDLISQSLDLAFHFLLAPQLFSLFI